MASGEKPPSVEATRRPRRRERKLESPCVPLSWGRSKAVYSFKRCAPETAGNGDRGARKRRGRHPRSRRSALRRWPPARRRFLRQPQPLAFGPGYPLRQIISRLHRAGTLDQIADDIGLGHFAAPGPAGNLGRLLLVGLHGKGRHGNTRALRNRRASTRNWTARRRSKVKSRKVERRHRPAPAGHSRVVYAPQSGAGDDVRPATSDLRPPPCLSPRLPSSAT